MLKRPGTQLLLCNVCSYAQASNRGRHRDPDLPPHKVRYGALCTRVVWEPAGPKRLQEALVAAGPARLTPLPIRIAVSVLLLVVDRRAIVLRFEPAQIMESRRGNDLAQGTTGPAEHRLVPGVAMLEEHLVDDLAWERQEEAARTLFAHARSCVRDFGETPVLNYGIGGVKELLGFSRKAATEPELGHETVIPDG
ncbi:hypothetical protein PG985_007762 [Apiospora marii]|uniref:uncharacterized protein n=1 Tax=Apiospora marii TaxID=335849 RepID=UPI00313174F0